ncbi:M48 family metalloprotease [uncultured Roseibium sp.]|uniref:M48 family metalloprotease n=1 Tax=uncultured Roseibium sp. TaxID=1936171 RepID=UPI00262FDC46|nr:M48 family metalloprotease [uncultured Roseibium sp.]
MKIVARIAAIELVRTVSLVAAAASAFCMVMLTYYVLALPFSLYFGRILLEDWQVFSMAFGLAVLPAIFVAKVPAVAASNFDVIFATRRPSEREMTLFGGVEALLQERSVATGIRLPRLVWRIQDSGELNAFAYAHNRVVFTKGLLLKYEDTPSGIERLSGVIAHEIGHLRNWDTRFQMLHHYLNLPINFGVGIADRTLNRIPFFGLLFIAMTTVLCIPAKVAEMLINSISRFTEYEADRFAARLIEGNRLSEILDDFSKMEEQQSDTFSAWIQRSHPPAELRHEAVSKHVL